MAKIGNETKLILKLAKERILSYTPETAADITEEEKKVLETIRESNAVYHSYVRGIRAGLIRYRIILDEIVKELEKK